MNRMTRVLVAMAVLVVVTAVFLGQVHQVTAEEGASVSRVVVVLAPTLRWDDLEPSVAPQILEAAKSGAVGNINLRSRAPGATSGGSVEGALTFSSGAWAVSDPVAATAYSVDEFYEGGSAAEAYERMTGVSAAGHRVVYLGMPRAQRLNAADRGQNIVVGGLGQAIIEAGGATAAVGTSDTGYQVRGLRQSRPAALIAMDADGRVRFGDVSPNLLANDPDKPFGYSTDLEVLEQDIIAALRDLDTAGGPGLLVVDPGDLQRAVDFAPDVTEHVAEEHRREAVAALDQVVGMVRRELEKGGTLVVVPQVATQPSGTPQGLAPVVVEGPGWSGLLTSSSTQREGLVTNLDVPATVLAELGVDVPVQVVGNPMRPAAIGSDAARIQLLRDMNAMAVAIEGAKWSVINAFIAGSTLLFVVCALVLVRAHRWTRRTVRRMVAAGSSAILLSLAIPAASWLMFAFDPRPTSMVAGLGWFALATALVWAVAMGLRLLAGARVPYAFITLVTAGVLLVDQWLGAPWSFTAYLGYSPLLGARYYGIGNEGAAILVAAVLIGTAFLLDEYEGVPLARHARAWGLPVVGLTVTVACAAPFWGANVGVVAWGVVAFGAAWALMNGVRFSWRLLVWGLVVIALFVAVFSYIDLTAGDGQTHLGRAWESAREGGVVELWTIVVRKAQTNLRVLTRTNWTYLLIVVLVLLGFMRWRPWGEFARALEENRRFSDAMAACLIGGLAAYFTEDSGIVIPALMMVYVGSGILYLMLARLVRDGVGTDETLDAA